MNPEDDTLLKNLAAGRTHADIARELGLKRTTVTARVRRLVIENQCTSTHHLIAVYGRAQGLREAADWLDVAEVVIAAAALRQRADALLP